MCSKCTWLCACKNPLVSRVRFEMLGKVRTRDELFVALIAGERPISSVTQSMCIEMRFLDEAFPANVAGVTSVVVVSSFVFPKRRRRRKACAAFQTRMCLRTRSVIENGKNDCFWYVAHFYIITDKLWNISLWRKLSCYFTSVI